MNYYAWGETSLRRMDGVDQILINLFSNVLKRSDFDLTIPWMGGKRNSAEQYQLFISGKSRADGVKNKSAHQPQDEEELEDSKALDVQPVGFHKMSEAELKRHHNKLSQLVFDEWAEMKASQPSLSGYKLRWGGLFNSIYDPAHWEIQKI